MRTSCAQYWRIISLSKPFDLNSWSWLSQNMWTSSMNTPSRFSCYWLKHNDYVANQLTDAYSLHLDKTWWANNNSFIDFHDSKAMHCGNFGLLLGNVWFFIVWQLIDYHLFVVLEIIPGISDRHGCLFIPITELVSLSIFWKTQYHPMLSNMDLSIFLTKTSLGQ